jgi:signal transduction histidine kinase
MITTIKQWSFRTILAATAVLSALPIFMAIAFPAQFNRVLEPASYVVFHNIAEFFSIMVSLSIFGVGWYTYERSHDRHALFLSAAFLAIGLMDFMHAMSNAAMPAFITANSSNKSTQFWIAARLFQASTFLASAFLYSREKVARLPKAAVLAAALLVSGLVFCGIIFFPSSVPDTFVQGVGLTLFKKFSEYAVVVLLCAAFAAYWRLLSKTGDRLLVYYLAALTVSVFGELNFAVYTKVFDTFNVLGHVYKIAAFSLIYQGIFIASVKAPYERLAAMSVSRDLLQAVNKELEAFIYSVSHDLRAPIRAMSGFANILAEDYADKLDEQAKSHLARIKAGSEKATRLIDDLLRLSKISRQDMDVAEMDLSGKASSVIADLREANPGRKVEVDIKPDLKASADARLMELVLSNLLGNAWKFTSRTDNALIEFGAAEKDGQAAYYVKDNGAGFDQAYAEKMFWPFQRLHSDDEFEGTGIGLTIVERVIRRHGGNIWAEGEVGKGATIYFALG